MTHHSSVLVIGLLTDDRQYCRFVPCGSARNYTSYETGANTTVLASCRIGGIYGGIHGGIYGGMYSCIYRNQQL
jgi:hypothetical protein